VEKNAAAAGWAAASVEEGAVGAGMAGALADDAVAGAHRFWDREANP
jgi:hypothetical protein